MKDILQYYLHTKMLLKISKLSIQWNEKVQHLLQYTPESDFASDDIVCLSFPLPPLPPLKI